MPVPKLLYDDSGLVAALREYMDVKKNVDPAKEIRRRAKNVGLRLVKLYGDAAPSAEVIRNTAKRIGVKMKIRQRIKDLKGKKGKGLSLKQQAAKETRARVAARKLTATGWFPAVKALGGTPRLSGSAPKGKARGSLNERLSGSNPSETLNNDQDGAERTDDRAGGGIQKALNAEMDDIQKYLDKKNQEAAQKAGLA